MNSMTARQQQLIRDTFTSVREMAAPLTQLFYGRLFAVAPSLRPMFRGDVRAQGQKLMDMLTVLMDGTDGLRQHVAVLRALGQRHAGYGVKPEHYPIMREAFGWALAQALEREFTPDVKAAWLALLDEVNSVMIAGADELTPR